MNRCRLCAEIVDINICSDISENPFLLDIIRRTLPVVVRITMVSKLLRLLEACFLYLHLGFVF